MEFSAAKLLQGAALVLALASLAGCNQQKNSQQTVAGHPRLRIACAADIQKLCANQPRRRRCLRENFDKLSENCKAAFAARRGRRAGGAANGGAVNGDNE